MCVVYLSVHLSVRLYVTLLCLWRIFQTPDWIIRLIHKTVHLCGWTCRRNEYFKAMSKQAVIGNMYRMHICSIFTHVPAQISNSRDSAVVYITYLLSYVWLRGRNSQSQRNICFVSLCKTLHLYCVIHVQPRKRHDWNTVHCNVKQWRRALKHLVMFKHLWCRNLFQGWQLPSKQGFRNRLNNLHCVLIKVNEHLK